MFYKNCMRYYAVLSFNGLDDWNEIDSFKYDLFRYIRFEAKFACKHFVQSG